MKFLFSPELWINDTFRRINIELEKMFLERDPERGKYTTILDCTSHIFTKEQYDKPTITEFAFREWLIPKTFEPEMDEIYYNLCEELYEKLLTSRPDKIQILTSLRKAGIPPKDVILEGLYTNFMIDVDVTGVLEKSGIQLVDEE